MLKQNVDSLNTRKFYLIKNKFSIIKNSFLIKTCGGIVCGSILTVGML